MKFVLIYVLAVNIVSFSCSNVEDARNHIVNVGKCVTSYYKILQKFHDEMQTFKFLKLNINSILFYDSLLQANMK